MHYKEEKKQWSTFCFVVKDLLHWLHKKKRKSKTTASTISNILTPNLPILVTTFLSYRIFQIQSPICMLWVFGVSIRDPVFYLCVMVSISDWVFYGCVTAHPCPKPTSKHIPKGGDAAIHKSNETQKTGLKFLAKKLIRANHLGEN